MSWLVACGIGIALVVLLWVGLILLARRLSPGPVRDVIAFLPACVTLIRRLRGNPAVPMRAKAALAVAAVWVASPIDLIPEFLPVVGPLDDIVVVALALRYAARQVPVAVLIDAWPEEDPHLLLRLLGVAEDPDPN